MASVIVREIVKLFLAKLEPKKMMQVMSECEVYPIPSGKITSEKVTSDW